MYELQVSVVRGYPRYGSMEGRGHTLIIMVVRVHWPWYVPECYTQNGQDLSLLMPFPSIFRLQTLEFGGPNRLNIAKGLVAEA